MIQSLAEAEQALMRECSDRAAPDCHKSVRPIYANTRREPRPKHSGSCTLLEIDGVRVLVTAAHIADEIGKGVKLYVGGPLWTRLVPIRGIPRATIAPEGQRDKDHLDFAFWVITDDTARALGDLVFIGEDRLSHNKAPPQLRYYMAYGYARSRNKTKVNHSQKAVGIRASR